MQNSRRKPLCMTSAAHGITRLNSCSSSAPAGRAGLAISASLYLHCRCHFPTNSFPCSLPQSLGPAWRSYLGCGYESSSWSEGKQGLDDLQTDACKHVCCDHLVCGIISINLFHQYKSPPLASPQEYWSVSSMSQCKCNVPLLKSTASNRPVLHPGCWLEQGSAMVNLCFSLVAAELPLPSEQTQSSGR